MTKHLRALVLAPLIACGSDSGTTAPDNTPASIAFNASGYLLSANGSLTLPVSVRRADFMEITDQVDVVWTSANPSLVNVDENGVATGSALTDPVTITASVGDLSATATVRVVPAEIVFTVASAIVVGNTATLTAEARDALGAPIDAGPVQWSSSAPTIASIDQTGFLTALASGSATIAASAAGRTNSRLVQTGIPSVYDGSYRTAIDASVTAEVDVVFGRVTRFAGTLRSVPGCTITLSVPVASAVITPAGTFSLPIPTTGTPGTTSGTFNVGNNVLNGAIGTLSVLGLCSGYTSPIPGGSYTAYR
ncbi:MAG TPA: Ig-like domain-containing protein [Gemmatimonadaceae bacterium]|nr:Ig-like domain-containing protein [Gemmatimonadaceae bacterium]